MTPERYDWRWHVALIGGFAVTGIAVALSQLESVTLFEWTALAGALLFADLGEWAVHRTTLHHPMFPRAVYHRHVVEHHAFFQYDTMAVDSLRDLRWVLFPPWALPLLVGSLAPFAVLAAVLVSPNAGWLFFLATIGYYGVYEIFHALAHFPNGHGLAGTRLVRAVSRHHRVHHDPRLMTRWNFNFAIPIGDRLFGTLWDGRATRAESDESTRAEGAPPCAR